MYLVQILLPLRRNDGEAFPAEEFDRVRQMLTGRFGGLTAFTRAPAEGLWKDANSKTTHDDIVVFEVMAEELDRRWWDIFRAGLEQRFAQDEVVVRALSIEQL